MELNFRSQNSANSTGRTPPYTVVTFEGKNYRILTKQHSTFLEMSKIWAVFWYLLGVSLLGSSFVLLFELKIPFVILICFCSHLLFTIYAFKKRSQFTNSIYFSSINLLIWLIPIIVLGFLQIKQILIPLCFFIVIQILLSIKYMRNKSQMVAKFLVLMEAMMIALKVDEKIQSSWNDVLFSHVVFFLFLSLCIIFMTVYLIYMKYTQNDQNLMRHKFLGALFIYFNTLAFCLLSALPLFHIFLKISIWVICFSLALTFICLGTFVYSYKKDIVIFFCTLNEIKSFNQIISFEPIEGIKNMKPEFLSRNKSKKAQKTMYLYRISQNWLTMSPQKATQTQFENPEVSKQQEENENKMTDCTICLDKPAQVVWMPCGHLTVCLQCCSFMFQKRNLNCVLCKNTPEQIYIIDTSQKSNLQKQQKSSKLSQTDKDTQNLDASIDNNDVSVISGSVMLEAENKPYSKTDLIQSKQSKQLKKKQPEKQFADHSNKTVFTVLEGYNVKIV